MNIINPHRFGLPLIGCDAADFDGTNDYALRGAGLTSAADSKKFTLCGWIFADDVASTHRLFSGPSSQTLNVALGESGSGILSIIGYNAATTKILDVAATSFPASAWRCVMCSFDMADAAKRHLYLGDTSKLDTVTTYTNDTIDFTTTQWSVGATNAGNAKFDGGMAEWMFWDGVYLDLSVELNRRMFISGTGKPIDPTAAGGAIATLGAPRVYFHLNDGEAANNFVANDDGGATGGAFTVTGALSTFASSPSD